jgi:hypothetical protein
MDDIIRRAPLNEMLQQSSDLLPARTHRIRELTVQSQLSVGIEPRLLIAWNVNQRYWAAGYSLLVFESTTAFSPELYPDELTKHGSLIIETRDDSYLEQVPSEGTHYYTFVLHKPVFFRLFDRMNVLRFSENVPSARVAVGRLRDQVELKGMVRQEKVGTIEHEAMIDEAKIRRIQSRRNLEQIQNPPPTPKVEVPPKKSVVSKKLDDADAKIEAAIAVAAKLKELNKDPRLKSLGKDARKALLKEIMEDLDLGQMSAESELENE